MWSDDNDFFVNYHIVKKEPAGLLSLPAVYPLYFIMADDHQASCVTRKLKGRFLTDGRLLATPNQTGNH